MPGENYYLITALPALPDLGEEPPMSLAALREHAAASASAEAVVEAILLGDDLLQRHSLLAGEIAEVSPAVLTAEQIKDEEPLPDYLVAEAEDSSTALTMDLTWSAYARRVAAVAARQHSALLAGWIAHEVALRNALAAARARALGLEGESYLVAVELGQGAGSLEGLVNEWSAAPDPLAGLRVLDRARSAWLEEHEAWFSFGDDEIAAYAVRLVLLHRWRRLARAAGPTGPQAGESESKQTVQ